MKQLFEVPIESKSLSHPDLDQETNDHIHNLFQKVKLLKQQLEEAKDIEEKTEIAKEIKKSLELIQESKEKKRIIKEKTEKSEKEISTIFTRPDGNQESITLSLEQSFQEFESFYRKTKLDLPPDFEKQISEIWERNQDEIEKAMEEEGYDGLLIIPGNIPLDDLKDKMSMDSGYYLGDNFENGGGFQGAKSQNADRSRIILYHKADSLPELSQKTGLDIHLNITAQGASDFYEKDPDHFLATLEDFLILERKHFEDTGKHLSDYKTNSAHWLPGTKSGARFVHSFWHPDDGWLYVAAHVPGSHASHLGLRPARCFF